MYVCKQKTPTAILLLEKLNIFSERKLQPHIYQVFTILCSIMSGVVACFMSWLVTTVHSVVLPYLYLWIVIVLSGHVCQSRLSAEFKHVTHNTCTSI